MKKVVVFLGRIDKDKNPEYFATGVLMEIKNIIHLVTSKHVVIDPVTDTSAFEGKLVFQDPTDESASILLTKIKNEKEISTGQYSPLNKKIRNKGNSKQTELI